MLSINTNLSSLIAQNSMSSATKLLNQAVERMTTGYKINHSKDNAVNYSISQKMQMQISSYDVAADNVAMGMDLVTTASDIISNMQDKASRLQALCTQARNGTYGQQSIEAINAEVAAIMKEIDRLCSTAEYNGVSLFEGGTEGNGFIADPVTYSDAEVKAMTTMTELVNGTTSADNTYSISSAEELEALARYINVDNKDTTGMTFVLGADIDLSSNSNWTPIGDYSINSSYQFKGTFDGNGHVIKNLKINNEHLIHNINYHGLFGYTANGSKIKNVGLENVNIKSSDYLGGLVGSNNGSVTNCFVTGSVSGDSGIGGLVGSNNGSVTNCFVIGSVSGDSGVGGLAGASSDSITNSFATCSVGGDSNVGGLVGYTDSDIINSYANGNVTGTGSSIGGLVGTSDGYIANSFATGSVSGNSNVGGLAGYNEYGSITNSYATGGVTGTVGPYSATNSDDWDGTKFSYETNNNTNVFTLQVGINSDSSCQISFDTNLSFDLSEVNTDISSDEALASIMNFQVLLNDKATALGAVENRLQSAIESIEVNIENLTSSLSTIRDADIAEVSSEYIRQQILQQASATLMATANQSPSIALQLI